MLPEKAPWAIRSMFERAQGAIASRLTTFGRVPFFFYLAHIALIHALAVVLAWTLLGSGWTSSQKPSGYGVGLFGVYAVWLCVVVALYPACAWFAELKRHRGEWWWSYV